ERVGQQRLPETVVLLGDGETEQAHLLHSLDDLRRVLVAVLELGGHRQDLVVDERAHGLEDLLLNLAETVGTAEAGHGLPFRASGLVASGPGSAGAAPCSAL